jgi:hypothetical protein
LVFLSAVSECLVLAFALAVLLNHAGLRLSLHALRRAVNT